MWLGGAAFVDYQKIHHQFKEELNTTSAQLLSAWSLKLTSHINHIQFLQVSPPFCYQLAKFMLKKCNVSICSLILLQANVWIWAFPCSCSWCFLILCCNVTRMLTYVTLKPILALASWTHLYWHTGQEAVLAWLYIHVYMVINI